MISYTTKRFRKLFKALPNEVQKQAKEAYIHFKKDPFHPGLYFKRVHFDPADLFGSYFYKLPWTGYTKR